MLMMGGFLDFLEFRKIGNFSHIETWPSRIWYRTPNNAGVDDFGIGLLLKTRNVKKWLKLMSVRNAEFERQLLRWRIRRWILIPTGQHCARAKWCAPGGAGNSRLLTPAWCGNRSSGGKRNQRIWWKNFLLESWLKALISSLVKGLERGIPGWKFGFLKETARNFKPNHGHCAGKILYCRKLKNLGCLQVELDQIKIPYAGDSTYSGFSREKDYEKRIEQRTISK